MSPVTRWSDQRERHNRRAMLSLVMKEYCHAIALSQRDLDNVMTPNDWKRTAQFLGFEYSVTQAALIGHLRLRLWGSKPVIHRVRRHRTPTTWWSHALLAFSQACHRAGLPFTWLRSKVRWTEIAVAYEYEHICPHANIAWPDGKHAMFLAHLGDYAPEESAAP